jgi:selenocysteine-specific elongation factor
MPEGANRPNPPLTVAVVGHVNHGKTALVRALTGIETDRLKEEIERGLSIALGFAWRDYASGPVDLIDAPGHEDFIRAMVAGATGARAVLLIVSSTEGFGRQTWEHLQVIDLLGIGAGIVAITKADLLPAGGEAAVRAGVQAALADTVLAQAPIVFCSAVSGQGLNALHEQLECLHRRSPPPEALAGAFLPIDRAFTVTGAGTVVTGTLQGGPLASGCAATLEPGGRTVGLRQIQVHGAAVDQVSAGGRVAVSLRGVAAGEVKVGDVLCAPDVFGASRHVDVLVTVASESPRALKHMDELRLMWGARRDTASVRLFGARSIPPGGAGLAQLRFGAPVIAFAGQRAVLRRLSPPETVGGALVLDPMASPVRGKASGRLALLEAVMTGDADRIAAGLAESSGGLISVADLSRLVRRPAADIRRRMAQTHEDLGSGRLARRDAIAEVAAAYGRELAERHRLAPARAGVSVGAIRAAIARIASHDVVSHVERALAASGAIRLDGNLVSLPGHDPFAALSPEAMARLDQIEAALRDGGVNPPEAPALVGPDGDDRDLLQLLIESGRAVSLRNVSLRQTLVFHRDALVAAHERLRSAFPLGSPFATGEARAALGTSRKFIVPILEHFDVQGFTVRHGDVRQAAGAPAPPVRTDASDT